MRLPSLAKTGARLVGHAMPRMADWPFAIKMGLLPLIGVVTLIVTVCIAASALDQQATLVDAVVQQDMAVALRLSDSATRLQHVDAGLYRVLTLQAAHSAEQPVMDDIAVLLSSLDDVLVELTAYGKALTDERQSQTGSRRRR